MLGTSPRGGNGAHEVSIWERLETAREVAGNRFDGGLFEREKEDWERRMRGSGEDDDGDGTEGQGNLCIAGQMESLTWVP